MKFQFAPLSASRELRPVVPVAFPGLDPDALFPALVDSGAMGTRVSAEIAEQMELDLRTAEQGRFQVGDINYRCWYVRVPMTVARYTWNCEVAFADGWVHDHALLGLRGFFEQFKVTIDTKLQTTTLTPLQHPGEPVFPALRT